MQNKQIDYSKANAGISEYIGRKQAKKQSHPKSAVLRYDRDKPVPRQSPLSCPDFRRKSVCKHIADGSSDAQLRQIEEIQAGSASYSSARQSPPQFLKKYLPGEKGDEKGDKGKDTLTRAFR